MNLMLLFDLVGSPTFQMILTAGFMTAGGACYLGFKVRQEKLLSAYTPLCFLPVAAALIGTLNGTTSSISMQLQTEQTHLSFSTTTLLLMHATPLLFGFTASTPALIITCCSRLAVLWREQNPKPAVTPKVDPNAEPNLISPTEQITREADEYLEKIMRPR